VTRSAHGERLVVATTNRGKLDELRALLRDVAVDVTSVRDVLGEAPHVVEDGATFAENAVKKARAAAEATQTLSLADDSGLEVDVLGGRPGVLSARFAHAHATDAENNAALLAALDEALRADPRQSHAPGDATFRARFRCVLALVDPATLGGRPALVEGVCEGAITRTARGSGGFGYDPLFVVAGTGRTMAELDPDEKNRVSHRARAFAALRPALEQVFAERKQVARRG